MATAALSRAERIAMANPQWSLGLMLLAVHAAIAWGIDEWWARAFLLAHFGLFLLWQPVWRGERDVEPRQAFVVVAVAFLFVGWYNWWLMAVWLATLFALIGGSVPRIADRRQRMISILAAFYLLSMLLVWVVPQLFKGQLFESAIVALVRYGLPILPAIILLVRVPAQRPQAPVGVDLFYSVLFFLLVIALVLGSFVVREVSQGAYVTALAQTLLSIGALLVGLSWLWYPHSGFAGIGYLLSSYLMSLGLPFERWVQRLAELAQEESQPQRFLTEAVQHMLDMPWVRGVEWRVTAARGTVGIRTPYATELSSGELTLKIHTRWAVSPSLLLHLKLLVQMVAHFYGAKQREQMQRQSAYTHAIYETGARLTHDVKNLLQSLKSLCAAASSTTPQQAPALQALIQRQLPQITQRLNTTLDKLRAPQPAAAAEVDAKAWWDALVQRYNSRSIEFVLDPAPDELTLPGELFDSVASNLIENALNKAAEHAALRIRVTFSALDRGTLSVCDDGVPVSKTVAAQLFEGAVASNSGFGVGLFQSSRLAAQCGYRLTLASNEPGRVCFVLSSESDALNLAETRHVA
ncbi:MAG TPA: HAMP domain-containing sensor histidine kinase [Burkholderiales bacterium]|nr:HAMP domain-containing sensor histidine kinase [Burkholderiales bacterium]